jgi:hypothetical protein
MRTTRAPIRSARVRPCGTTGGGMDQGSRASTSPTADNAVPMMRSGARPELTALAATTYHPACGSGVRHVMLVGIT